MRVFYAHPSGEPPEEILKAKKKVHSLIIDKMIRERGSAPAVKVVAGRDDYKRHWKGDWTLWQESVITRKDAITGKPVYDAFITKNATCGRATANILGAAIVSGRPVFFWDGEDGFVRVKSVAVEDPEDWTDGYRICREPEQMDLFGGREAHG